MVDDQLQGFHLNGTVIGGATLIPAVMGNAISFNGVDQYVDFGRHDSCLTNPGLCSDGITWAVWLYSRSASHAYVVTSGSGYATGEAGFALLFRNGHVKIAVRSTTKQWISTLSDTYIASKWMHVTMTWDSIDLTKVYINGQVVTGTLQVHYDTCSSNSCFNLGRSTGGDKYADVAVDELLVWYSVKPTLFIQKIYQSYVF